MKKIECTASRRAPRWTSDTHASAKRGRYGNPYAAGQISGGRWKPIHYWYRKAIFTDQFAACDHNCTCFVRNDSPHSFVGGLVVRVTEFATGSVQTLLKQNVTLDGGGAALVWVDLPGLGTFDGAKFILETIVHSNSNAIVSHNVVPWATPEMMQLIPSNVSATAVRTADGGLAANVSVKAVAVYVLLSTLASGRFEDNAFLTLPPGRLVHFVPTAHEELKFERFAESLRVEDVSTHQHRQASWTRID